MRIDTEDLRRNYASLTDEALEAIDRSELVDAARKVYDEEVARRRLDNEAPESSAEPEPVEIADDGHELEPENESPEWLDDATCLASFSIQRGAAYADAAVEVSDVLRAARIPCWLTVTEPEPDAPPETLPLCNVMVPVGISLHASSVLDRDLYNQEIETVWRAHLEKLSDADLHALNPKIFCAGMLDRVERLKRAYADEMARRNSR